MRAAALALVLSAGSAEAACRQALALGLDVSGSVDAREEVLQVEGLARALEDPGVREAILALPEAPVRLAVFEWSGETSQRLIVPWTEADSAAAIDAVVRAVRESPRLPAPPETAVGAAMIYGAALLADQAECTRLTLDLSGDGRSNTGPHPAGVEMGAVTVNALAVGVPDRRGDRSRIAALAAYFQTYVIRGPDAFVAVALGYGDFERAMKLKLRREMSLPAFAAGGAPGPVVPGARREGPLTP